MEARKPNRFYLSERRRSQKPSVSRRSDLRRSGGFRRPELSPFLLIKQFLLGLRRLLVALKYQLDRLFPGSSKLPWLKLGAAALLVFMVFKRDLQFQVNMQSPLEVAEHERRQQPSAISSVASQSVTQAVLLEEAETETPAYTFEILPTDDAETKTVKNYIRRFKEVAQTEMNKFGIPASIQMAQAIVESNAGRGRLAARINNHFGIKCFSKSCGKGHCSNFSDDHHKDFFRIYKTAWESWRSHSKLISSGKYKSLLKHNNDREAWARGLQELGYATDKRYAQKLLNIIDKYHLYLLDR